MKSQRIMLPEQAEYGQRCLVHFTTNYEILFLFPDNTQVILSNIGRETGANMILIPYTNEYCFMR